MMTGEYKHVSSAASCEPVGRRCRYRSVDLSSPVDVFGMWCKADRPLPHSQSFAVGGRLGLSAAAAASAAAVHGIEVFQNAGGRQTNMESHEGRGSNPADTALFSQPLAEKCASKLLLTTWPSPPSAW